MLSRSDSGKVAPQTTRHVRTTHDAHNTRNVRVEWLRLFAICGIAIFHIAQVPFNQIVQASGAAYPPGSFIGWCAGFPPMLWLLAVLMPLGVWGNHVFFMISGYFLVSNAARRAGVPGFWRREYRSVARRVVRIVAAVVFYILLLLAVNRWMMPLEGVGTLWWVTYDLEFIVLYVLFVACAPLIGWVYGHLDGRWITACIALAAVVVMALNIRVALEIGDFRGRLQPTDWRKLMSGITYAISFLCAAAFGCWSRDVWGKATGVAAVVSHGANEAGVAAVGEAAAADGMVASDNVSAAGDTAEAPDKGTVPAEPSASDATCARTSVSMRRCRETALVLACLAILAVVGLVCVFVARGEVTALAKMSFKSTSPFAFVLALCALVLAVVPAHATGPTRTRVRSGDGLVARAVRTLASGILGFYIFSALGYSVTQKIDDAVVAELLRWFGHRAIPAGWAWLGGWLVAQTLFVAASVVVVCLFDVFVRQRLLRVVKLA